MAEPGSLQAWLERLGGGADGAAARVFVDTPEGRTEVPGCIGFDITVFPPVTVPPGIEAMPPVRRLTEQQIDDARQLVESVLCASREV